VGRRLALGRDRCPVLPLPLERRGEDRADPDWSVGAVSHELQPRELDAVIDQHAPQGWQMSFHCNGDVGFDVVLDVYERGLTKHNLMGTDHRWRVEHLGACRKEQFKRAAQLGVEASMGPFQFLFWGDLLDGTLFAPEIGSQWQAIGDAFAAGLEVSFHNDGSVTPPNVLLNIQGSVTRTTNSGTIHGANQKITLDQALRAVTINGARQLAIDDKVGSLEVGKQADLVELSMDPYAAAPLRVATQVSVLAPGWGPAHRPRNLRSRGGGHGPSTAPGAGEAQSARLLLTKDGSGRQWARRAR